jgi:hypothetical protein
MRFAIVAVLAFLVLAVSMQGQQVHRNSFESRQTSWQKGMADAVYEELGHELTGQTAHSGQQSEAIRLQADQGSHIYYVYPIGKAEIVDELSLSLWLKANRPGLQLFARVILPRERNPNNLDQPLTTVLRGSVYQMVNRWQRLDLRGPVRQAQQQQQLMRVELRRDVNFEGAYIDQLQLNVYGGRGLTEVWIDDVEISPMSVEVAPMAPAPAPAAPGLPAPAVTPVKPPRTPGNLVSAPLARHAIIELNQEQLRVNRKPFFIRGIRHSNTPLKALRDAGFNTLWLDHTVSDQVLAEALHQGFWLGVQVPVLEDPARFGTPENMSREIARLAACDAVLFWDLGGGRSAEQAEAIGQAALAVRAIDPYQGRPIAGNVWDGYQAYSRHLEIVGTHRWPLLTGMELSQYRDWLVQRRFLGRPGTFMWTWIQTHLPEWYLQLVHGPAVPGEFHEPIGPQPEQIRLLTYLAISAGYRGLGFWSDQFLANTHQGRDRLLQLALLNQELEMLEPLLAGSGQPSWIPTKHPEVKAAVFRFKGGVLVLPIWIGAGAQFVPGQLAMTNLEIVVPEAPQDAQVWEVSPGDVRPLKRERVAGGLKVVVPEFGLTTALLFTADITTIARLQDSVAQTRRLAAQWSYDLAVEELRKVEQVHQQLVELRQTPPDSRALLEDARRRLGLSWEAWQRNTPSGYREAYLEAHRAVRPLRILMRSEWQNAIKTLDHPVASPYAVSYYTLPKHWRMMQEKSGAGPGSNFLAQGDFERVPADSTQAWTMEDVTLDAVRLSATLVDEDPREGRQCLKLEAKPQDVKTMPAALERTFLAAHGPRLQLRPGSLVQISGWVKVPAPIQASPDGVLFFDSIGGESLAIRLSEATPWRKFTLYRRVPDSGTVQVTLALTGLGTAYFDDIRVEPLLASASTASLERR